jgi:hypothetical protein
MSFIGYTILAFAIYEIADRYIISPEWYARRDAEASELLAMRNAERYASAARADGANYVEVQRQARIGYNLSRSLDSPAPVAAAAPSRAIAPPDRLVISPDSEDSREIGVSRLCDQGTGVFGLDECSLLSPAILDRNRKKWLDARHYVSQGYECKLGRFGRKGAISEWYCYRTDGRKWAGEL